MFILPSVEMQIALEQTLEKIGEITLHLHQMNEIMALLNYGVQETQELFESDRTLVYQFLPGGDGVVIAEAVRAGWQSVIGQLIEDSCFQTHWAEQYRQGRISQVANVEQSSLAPCHIEFLTQLQVKANLVAPIIVRRSSNSQVSGEPELWGLLIIQQCSIPRNWHALEVQILKQLTLQLGIAIAHLEARNQWQADLQQRITAEVQLRQSEGRLRQIIDQSPVVIMTHAPDGTVRSANPAWETLWGRSRDALLGFNPFHDPQLMAAGHLQFWQRVQAGEVVTYTPLYYDPALNGHEGHPQWHEGKLYPIKDDTGNIQEIVLIQYDVTARITAQQERDRFFTNTHDIMAISDQNGAITLANPAWQTVLGYASEALIGVRFLELFHPDDRSAAHAAFQQHMLTQQSVLNHECRCCHQDGSYRWIAWNAFYYNEMSYGFGRDITQQKQLETTLLQQEERWQLAIRGSNDGIWDWNIETGEWFLSPRWKEMLGYTDEEIGHDSLSWESRLHPDDLDRVRQAIQDHLARTTPFFEAEQRMLCKDGNYKWVLARAQAVWNQNGQAIRMVGSHTDISARKQAELALQEREETLQLLIKYAPVNIAMFDKDMKYLMITQRGVDAYQLGSIESVLGRSYYEVVPAAAQWRPIHQRCLAGAIETCDESLLVREDGTQYWTRWEIHPWYKPNQQVGGIILFSEDITTQIQAEQELQHSVGELTRLNQLKDDFLSTVSHELRTPISNIKIATQMLEISLNRLGISTDESSPLHRYFKVLQEEEQREIHLINDLLDLTRLDAETEPLNLTSIDLRDYIPHLIEIFVERARQHRQQFIIQIPDNLPLLTTDRSDLERLLTELLENACKYTPAGETIAVSAQTLPEALKIRVSNSGVEIPAIEHERIFDKFYRIPNNDPWKYGGTGLGLTLVKKIAARLGGNIRVESGNGQTAFTLEFRVS